MLRLLAVVIAIEAAIYVILSLYLRSLERERLEEEWDAANPGRGGDRPGRAGRGGARTCAGPARGNRGRGRWSR